MSSALRAADDHIQAIHTENPRDGFYLAMTTGQVIFTGLDRSSFHKGWMTGLKLGYDIGSYYGFEGQFKTSFHNSAIAGASSPGSFVIYHIAALAKGAYPITRRFHVGVGAGGGFWYAKPRMRSSITGNQFSMIGNLSLEYFLRIRHLSIGLETAGMGITNLKSVVFEGSAFVRYTF